MADKCCIGTMTLSGEVQVTRYRPHPVGTIPPIPYDILVVAGMKEPPFHPDRYTVNATVTGSVNVLTKTVCDTSGPDCSPGEGDTGPCSTFSSKYKTKFKTKKERTRIVSEPVSIPPPFLNAGGMVGAQSEWQVYVSFNYTKSYHLGCCSLPCSDKAKAKTHDITPYEFPWEFEREYWINKNGEQILGERPLYEGGSTYIEQLDGSYKYAYDGYAVNDAMGLTWQYSSDLQFDDILNKIISQYGKDGSVSAAEFETCCSSPEEPNTNTRSYQVGR